MRKESAWRLIDGRMSCLGGPSATKSADHGSSLKSAYSYSGTLHLSNGALRYLLFLMITCMNFDYTREGCLLNFGMMMMLLSLLLL